MNIVKEEANETFEFGKVITLNNALPQDVEKNVEVIVKNYKNKLSRRGITSKD